MVDYREILRPYSLKYSQREIVSSVHSSRNTVKEVLNIAAARKISWPLDVFHHLSLLIYLHFCLECL